MQQSVDLTQYSDPLVENKRSGVTFEITKSWFRLSNPPKILSDKQIDAFTTARAIQKNNTSKEI